MYKVQNLTKYGEYNLQFFEECTDREWYSWRRKEGKDEDDQDREDEFTGKYFSAIKYKDSDG